MQRIADVGVDVSKQELVIAIDGQPKKQAVIENQAPAIRQWLSGLPAGSRIAMESTGRYHGLLAILGQDMGFRVYVLNANDVSHYAKALGARGKTDRTDAEMIARNIAEHHDRLHSYQSGNDVQQRIDALLRRRATVVMHRQAILEALHDVPEIRQETDMLQARFAALIGAINQQLQAQLDTDEQMAVPFRRLSAITGFGLQTSAMLVSLFTRSRLPMPMLWWHSVALIPALWIPGRNEGNDGYRNAVRHHYGAYCFWQRCPQASPGRSVRSMKQYVPVASLRRLPTSFLRASYCGRPMLSGRVANHLMFRDCYPRSPVLDRNHRISNK